MCSVKISENEGAQGCYMWELIEREPGTGGETECRKWNYREALIILVENLIRIEKEKIKINKK